MLVALPGVLVARGVSGVVSFGFFLAFLGLLGWFFGVLVLGGGCGVSFVRGWG